LESRRSFLDNIKWNEDLYTICLKYLNLITKLGYNSAKSMMNLNKTISEYFKGKYKCQEILIHGLFEILMSASLVLIDKNFFNYIFYDNFTFGASACINYKDQFLYILVLVKKVEDNKDTEKTNEEIDVDSNRFIQGLPYKDKIIKADLIYADGIKHILRLYLIDGSTKEEILYYNNK